MSKEALKNLIDNVAEEDYNTLFTIILRFVKEADPLPDEIQALQEAEEDTSDLIPHDAINW